MSLDTVLARINQINALLPAAAPVMPVAAAPSNAAGGTQFSGMLQKAMGPAAVGGVGAGGSSKIVAFAQGEVGQTEAPKGSNNSARITEYRSAVPGGPVGPWCAYFASWAARQAGTPLGNNGQGFARVDDVWAWAQSSGRAVPAASGSPRPGDLIIWDEHMGIVESVEADGTIRTIEGNSSDAVSRRSYKPPGGSIIGYVRLGGN